MIDDPKNLNMWLEGTAAAVDLKIPAAYREDVILQLEMNRSLIAPLLDFELPAASYDN